MMNTRPIFTIERLEWGWISKSYLRMRVFSDEDIPVLVNTCLRDCIADLRTKTWF